MTAPIDPAPGLGLIQDAYALAAGAPESSVFADDLIYGTDWGGRQGVFAVVRAGRIGLRGTDDPVELVMDADIVPQRTEFGLIAGGVLSVYRSLRTRSGRPLSDFAGYPVDGHSLGAGLAAILAVFLRSPYCLWACPKWFGDDFIAALAALPGRIFAEAGDIVPHLPPLGYPSLPPPTYLLPLGTGDILYHHALSTYAASYAAQSQLAAA